MTLLKKVMQDYGVNLICVEDGIDSYKDVWKLMISVLSAVAEIERENIRVQIMEGRIQKVREGKWNGGFAPYGYLVSDTERRFLLITDSKFFSDYYSGIIIYPIVQYHRFLQHHLQHQKSILQHFCHFQAYRIHWMK